MKKVFLTIVVIIMCICLSGCKAIISAYEGFIDIFEVKEPTKLSPDSYPGGSSYGAANNLIPEDFVDKFAYADGYYYGRLEEDLFNLQFIARVRDRAFLFLEYDDETYLQAKEYVFNHLELSEESVGNYGGYVFYDNLAFNDHVNVNMYSQKFAYNDDKNSLIFTGIYLSYQDGPKLNDDDLGAFLEEHYGEWYDFSE